MYVIVKKILFLFDPEYEHHLVMFGLRFMDKIGLLALSCEKPKCVPRIVGGIKCEKPGGLAAGMDKNASYIDTLSWLGFGFIAVGTVTPKPQPGNKKPRLFRLPRDKALINSMGFNNDGLNTFVNNLKKSKWVKQKKGLIGINLDMNFDTNLNNAHLDYETGLDATYKYADYIVINISSPNTKGLRKLQENIFLKKLLASLKKKQKKLLAK